MSGFILGIKADQSQQFTEEGNRIPVTNINTSPCFLIDVKVADKIGYFAAKIGLGKKHTMPKPQAGELKKAGIQTPLRFLREIRLEKYSDITAIEEGGKKGLQIGEAKIM